MYQELESDTLKQVIDTNELVFVQFSAGWCGNCRIMKPKFKAQAEANSQALFIGIDAEKNAESRKLAQVSNLPTFAAFKNGILVNQIQTNKAEVLNTFIHEITGN